MVAAAILALSGVALGEGQDRVRTAREAYDRGAAAFDAGDFAAAAKDLARADALVPNAVALELAIKAALLAGDAPFGMILVERAEARESGASLAATATEARAKLITEVGRIKVSCPLRRTCRATLDGELIPITERTWVRTGDHAVELSVDDRVEAHRVHIDAGQDIEVASSVPPGPLPANAAPPAVPPVRRSPPAPEPHGWLAPGWFWAASSATAVLGGLALASAIDTKNKHSQFLADPSFDRQSEGQSAQVRTNVLAGGTVVAGVGTLILGVFAVRWQDERPSALSLTPEPTWRARGARLTVRY